MMTNLLNGAHVANKLFSTIARLRFLLVMFLTLTVSTEVWGYTGTFEKITSTSQLTTGYYIIVASADAKAVGNTVDSNKRIAGVDVTISNNNITNPDDAIVYYIAKSGDNYTFNNVGNGKYLYQASTTSGKGMGFTSESKNITCAGYNANSPEGFKFTLNGGSNNYFKWNKSSNWFANYSNDYTTSMTPVRLFKLTSSGTISVTGVSLNKSTLTLTEGSSETLIATVSPNNATDKTITWSTSNSSVATVSDGKVTAVAEGSATITVTTTDGGKTATCDVTVNPKPKYTVTLNAGSGTCAESVTEPNAGDGVTLPTPTLSSACQSEGWSFAGWATASVGTETTTEPTLIAAGAYSPTSDITLYAVYQRTETTSGGGGGGVATVVDNLTHSINGQKSSNTSYVEFSDITYTSEAKYAGSTSNGNNSTITGVIQIRSSSSNTGIITTASGGKVKKVIVVWDSGTNSGRTLDVYGKNSPYDAVGNLYSSDAATKGTKLGSIVCGTSTELNITEDYEYIGLRSASNAMYLTSIAITWESTTGGSGSTTYYHSTPDCGITEPSRCVTHKMRG